MAFINQEQKNKLAPKIKEVLKKYGLKGSISIHDYMVLVVTISQGGIDFIGNYITNEKDRFGDGLNHDLAEDLRKHGHLDVNTYSIDRSFDGKAKDCLLELKDAMMEGNHDNSDSQIDYFDVGWYVTIQVGKWNKPYQLIA